MNTEIDEGANLRNAYLTGAQLMRPNLAGACLDGAYLSAANFRDAVVTGASFEHAIWDQATTWPNGRASAHPPRT